MAMGDDRERYRVTMVVHAILADSHRMHLANGAVWETPVIARRG